ncbi:hypothetical protein Btru_049265 [Bulinus truncatus]|nr:hypothetical protein Btru_049265 [Bulinus truncatus]
MEIPWILKTEESLTFDPDFDLASPNAQKWILQFCSRLTRSSFTLTMSYEEVHSFYTKVSQWVLSRLLHAPLEMKNGWLKAKLFNINRLSGDIVSSEIVSSDIVSSEIVSSDIVSNEIVPSEIVSSEIVSSEIVSSDIVSSEIVSSEIVSCDIVSSDIRDCVSGIVSSEIVSSDIVSSDIVSSEIVSSEIVSIEIVSSQHEPLRVHPRVPASRHSALTYWAQAASLAGLPTSEPPISPAGLYLKSPSCHSSTTPSKNRGCRHPSRGRPSWFNVTAAVMIAGDLGIVAVFRLTLRRVSILGPSSSCRRGYKQHRQNQHHQQQQQQLPSQPSSPSPPPSAAAASTLLRHAAPVGNGIAPLQALCDSDVSAFTLKPSSSSAGPSAGDGKDGLKFGMSRILSDDFGKIKTERYIKKINNERRFKTEDDGLVDGWNPVVEINSNVFESDHDL